MLWKSSRLFLYHKRIDVLRHENLALRVIKHAWHAWDYYNIMTFFTNMVLHILAQPKWCKWKQNNSSLPVSKQTWTTQSVFPPETWAEFSPHMSAMPFKGIQVCFSPCSWYIPNAGISEQYSGKQDQQVSKDMLHFSIYQNISNS